MLPWNDAFSVGHPELDSEHHQMLELINNICVPGGQDPSPGALRIVLTHFEHLASEHFAHEESILSDIRNRTICPELRDKIKTMVAKHHEVHQSRLSALHKLIETLNSDNDAPRTMTYDSLRNWFIVHVIRHDSHVKNLIQGTEVPAL